MNFCPNCGSANVEHKIPDGDTRLRHFCNDCKTIHYQNPNIIVGCLVLHEDKLMLCQRKIEPRAGLWNLPAGFMENGETVQAGARREVWEEANADVEIIRLHSVYDVLHVNQVYMIFLAKLKKPAFSAGDETLDVQLFSPSEIPFAQLAFYSNHFTLNCYLKDPDYQGIHYGNSVDYKP